MEVEECQTILEYEGDDDEEDLHVAPSTTSNEGGGNQSHRVLQSDVSDHETPDRNSPDIAIEGLSIGTRHSLRLSKSSRGSSLDENVHDLFEASESSASSPTRSHSPQYLPVESKTYGGFKVMTWKTIRSDMEDQPPKYYRAKDIPHSLQDHINRMSDYTRMLPGMRDIFLASIQEGSAEEECDVPDIELINNIDDEPTPPWEFHYSNHMWHGEGVPPPDMKNLVRCDCIGGCDPRSKTCACLKQQSSYYDSGVVDFAYDNRGRLKRDQPYPIFECNSLCACDDSCRNRVVQHGRKVHIKIMKTAEKGWGVFAGPKKIPRGTFIGIYAGELITDAEGEIRGEKYDTFGRTYLLNIDPYYLKEAANEYVVDAYHVGNFTRFLNHSCDPNVRIFTVFVDEGNIEKPYLTLFTVRDVEVDEEICFNYRGDDDDEDNGSEGLAEEAEATNKAVHGPCKCGAVNCTGRTFKPA
ncbi:hypothetical protein BDQ12DRAFT_618597 [Crucibulum laeve]|uniref:SET domain-containing protein n=1 Tax=Crucibulum laeve TaxID=68775 RepID=A0A5C3LG65_9AGAR|nr:hypothetical protein BDQ12DRAFT_618597 [Crucibulum laeve]